MVQVLELPVKMIYAKVPHTVSHNSIDLLHFKVTAMIFDFDDGDEDKHTQFDARKQELVDGDQDVSALTAMEGTVSLGGVHNGREF